MKRALLAMLCMAAVANACTQSSNDTIPSILNEIVVTANRSFSKRVEAPVAISILHSTLINDTKAAGIDQLLNKVSGVNMVSLGNEQHQMSIRQPMTTRSLFLYLEDGIPIRTSGLFNHNALLEMNAAATQSIEVIKGPSSSLYGAEAIGGVVNFITLAPSATPLIKASVQGNDIGYKRSDLQSSFRTGKWGFALSGYYAHKRNGYLEYNDFHKGIGTARIDYTLSPGTKLSNSITAFGYYSDMSGGIDSAMFAAHSFQNPQTFTYRKVKGWRYHSTLTQDWNDNSHSSISMVYRTNTIGQNPAYRIKNDYRLVNGSFTGEKDLAHGEINESSFHSYAFVAQHRQQFKWKMLALTAGLSVDLSPSRYSANYIRIQRDSITRKYVSYQATDSVLTSYNTQLNNYASFFNIELNATSRLHLVAALRYDLFNYNFNNHLRPSAFSGSPDTLNRFSRASPKLGFTYRLFKWMGVYANYSEGFVPPQVTELYTGVKVPDIQPSVFYNYEAGAWMQLLQNKLSADLSVYRLNGTNEIISVRLDDGSYANANAGKTSHTGIEMGLNAKPVADISFRISGAWNRHRFMTYNEKGVDYSGNEMNNAPHWLYNAELWYRPSFAKGLRIGTELQHVGSYYADPLNLAIYKGYTVLNGRIGYRYKAAELWLHLLNFTNRYYSYITTKSSSGYSYQPAEPRNFTIGLSYDFGSLIKTKKS